MIGKERVWNQACEVPLPRHSPLWTKSKERRLFEMAASIDARIRAVAANHPRIFGYSSLGLLLDPDPFVRSAAVRNTGITYGALRVASGDIDPGIAAYAKMRLEETNA